jgi:hypothetical protein
MGTSPNGSPVGGAMPGHEFFGGRWSNFSLGGATITCAARSYTYAARSDSLHAPSPRGWLVMDWLPLAAFSTSTRTVRADQISRRTFCTLPEGGGGECAKSKGSILFSGPQVERHRPPARLRVENLASLALLAIAILFKIENRFHRRKIGKRPWAMVPVSLVHFPIRSLGQVPGPFGRSKFLGWARSRPKESRASSVANSSTRSPLPGTARSTSTPFGLEDPLITRTGLVALASGPLWFRFTRARVGGVLDPAIIRVVGPKTLLALWSRILRVAVT